ncbi:hypothetical protein Tco_1191960 [Tanacetum coccineum]
MREHLNVVAIALSPDSGQYFLGHGLKYGLRVPNALIPKEIRPFKRKGYSQKTNKQAKNDKTEHGMEKCEKTKPKSQSSQKVNRKVKQSKSTPSKSKSEEI